MVADSMLDNVKIEVEEPRAEGNDLPVQEDNKTTIDRTDTVTALQDSVDNLALSMFNALRLLPTQDDPASDETCANAVRRLY